MVMVVVVGQQRVIISVLEIQKDFTTWARHGGLRAHDVRSKILVACSGVGGGSGGRGGEFGSWLVGKSGLELIEFVHIKPFVDELDTIWVNPLDKAG